MSKILVFTIILLFTYPAIASAGCGKIDIFGWQQVDAGYTYRMKVPGGWLTTYKSGYGVTNVFIPDPEYKWRLKCGT